MKEKEVLRRLGFEEDENLGEVKQLRNYSIEYTEGNNNNYFRLTDNKKPAKIIEDFSSHNQIILPVCHYEYGRVIITGWRGCLSENMKEYVPEDVSHKESWINKRKKEKGNKAMLLDTLMREALSKNYEENLSATYCIDAGHVFGRFTRLTSYIGDILGSNQNVNNINIYPQVKEANEISNTERKSQLDFENEARDNKPCYYEAEAICKEWTDIVPIGTRIRIIDIQNSKELHHVFIPNCKYPKSDEGKNSDSGSKDTVDNENSTSEPENTVDDYRAFFKGGDLNSLKWKKADTPKNNK